MNPLIVLDGNQIIQECYIIFLVYNTFIAALFNRKMDALMLHTGLFFLLDYILEHF